ncbi:MAG: hypothetical protein ABH873_04595 [Candidatus Firestonebacteria bacterium]
MKKIKVFFCFIFLLALTNISCSPFQLIGGLFPDEKEVQKKEEKERRERLAWEKADKEVNEKLKDPNYYCEKALAEYAEFDGNSWKTIEEAKKRARLELAKRLKVRVINTVSDTIKKDNKLVEEKFESKTTTYVDALLENVKVEEFEKYREKDQVTAIAYLPVRIYKDKVEADLKSKKISISTPFEQGLEAMKQKNYGQALTQFINSRAKLVDSFSGLLNEDIDEDGKTEDVGGILSARISEIVNNLELKSLDDKIFFDSDGKITKKPTVFVSYRVDSNNRQPVSGIPLKVAFIKGEGKISEVPLKTSGQGDLEIPIENINVDSSTKEVTVNVEIDGEKIGLEKTFYLPICRIEMYKKKAVAYCVNFFSDGLKTHPASWVDEIKGMIIDYGFGVEEYDIKEKDISTTTINDITKTNVDYFIYVMMTSESKKDPYDMYNAMLTSKASIYSFPEEKIYKTIEGISASGYSTTGLNAGYDALGKVKNTLMDKIKAVIKDLK